MRKRTVGWVAAFVAALSAGAWAQDHLSLEGPARVPAVLQDEGKDANFTIGIRTEMKRYEMDFDDSSATGVGGADPEQAIDFFTQHNATFLVARVDYKGMETLVLSAHAGLGLESLVSTLDGDNSPLIGDNVLDDRFDDGFAWELGGGVGLTFEQVDIGLRGTYRSGSTDVEDDATTDIEYDYALLKVELEGGYRAMEYLRPFVGVSYTLYEGDWTLEDPSAGLELDYDLELDQPVGVFVGADLFVSTVTARFQAEFLDNENIAFLVFLGLIF